MRRIEALEVFAIACANGNSSERGCGRWSALASLTINKRKSVPYPFANPQGSGTMLRLSKVTEFVISSDVGARHVVTIISTDMPPSPTRSDDLFATAMSAKLFQPIKESTAPPTSMPLLPGTLLDYDRIVPVTLTNLTDEAELPMREPIARNASANESSLNLFKQSLKVPLGCSWHSQPTWRYL
jgi:hypothetical protein